MNNIEYWDSKEAYLGPHMQTPHMLAFLRRAQQFLAEAPHFGFWQQFATAS